MATKRTSSTTRRRARRQVQQRALADRREQAATLAAEDARDAGAEDHELDPFTDSVYGYELRPLRGPSGRFRLRWLVDRDPFMALIGLQALQEKVLDPLEVALVADCRAEGLSWEDVGFALGISGEGARKKHAASMDAVGL